MKLNWGVGGGGNRCLTEYDRIAYHAFQDYLLRLNVVHK